ncbi:MAG: amidohydrolase family protein, partial [Candidatus Korarchaeota archaeon]|nr:amidohydrolase family protein [Candidatus Korarchaeota archaeon]
MVRGGVVAGLRRGWILRPDALDLRAYTLAPGFIDTHIHGCCGHDTNTSSATGIRGLSEKLARYGVTGFLPTTVTADHEALLKIAKTVSGYVEEAGGELLGAEPLGLHMEGPYINPEMRGAQNPEYIRPPSIEEFDEYVEASRGTLKVMDLAPELEGALDLSPHASRRGVAIGLGHTNATYEEALRAIAAGASRATHVFNA